MTPERTRKVNFKEAIELASALKPYINTRSPSRVRPISKHRAIMKSDTLIKKVAILLKEAFPIAKAEIVCLKTKTGRSRIPNKEKAIA
jgi:hypothetical protein